MEIFLKLYLGVFAAYHSYNPMNKEHQEQIELCEYEMIYS